jgi:hypothetical protein
MDASAAVEGEGVISKRTVQIATSADRDIITGGVNCSDKSGVALNSDRAAGSNANKGRKERCPFD